MWNNETYKEAVYGSTVFHSGDELGSEIAVSCDMCHPRAANTHPETYPKFQPQLGPRRTAPRHDQLVHRTPGARQGPAARRPEDAGAGGLHPGAAQGSAAGLRQALDRGADRALGVHQNRAGAAGWIIPHQARQQRQLVRPRKPSPPYQAHSSAGVGRVQRPYHK